ncbi:MAG: copper amine oxidase N-terminal domain-containing protein [Clostridiales bacterium]|jgi:hypothetical protein|nr:copper amine oxidase N-terminal domain-containing protein [Clostridiales bacterium]
MKTTKKIFAAAIVIALCIFSTAAVYANTSGTIQQLSASGTIDVQVTGSSIEHTNVRITNNSRSRVTVYINAGTWFESNSGSVQNMLVTSGVSVVLNAGQTSTTRVSTACMNIRRDIPNSSHGFQLQELEQHHQLTRLVRYFDENPTSYPVRQAAVWIVTDHSTDSQLRGSLTRGNTSVIQQSHIDEARRILSRLDENENERLRQESERAAAAEELARQERIRNARVVNVVIDGVPVVFEGQQPIILDGRTLVPVRGVFERLGFTISWDETSRSVTLADGINSINIGIDSAHFYENGISRNLDVPAQIIDGRTMLPVRAIAESGIGLRVDWNEATSTVSISRSATSGNTPASAPAVSAHASAP